MTQKDSAATQRRSIGRQLAAARLSQFPDLKEEASLQAVAKALRVHPKTIKRLEGGKVKPDYTRVESACRLYGMGEEATRRILEMVDQAETEEWHEQYRQDIQPWFVQLLDLEAVANRITFFALYIPGWAQTPAYAASVATADQFYENDHDYARRLGEIRSRRAQQIFSRKNVQVSLLLDEPALLAQVGSAEIMAEQIAHLRALDRKRNVSIRILPLSTGARAGTRGWFTVLEFDDVDEPNIAYSETYLNGQYSVRPSKLKDLLRTHEILVGQSVPLKEYER